jgi:DNA-binding transcriptional MocR family regulator
MPPQVDALELYQQALQHRISIAPGPIFSPTRKYRNHIRLNCGVNWEPKTENAVATLGKLARAFGEKT